MPRTISSNPPTSRATDIDRVMNRSPLSPLAGEMESRRRCRDAPANYRTDTRNYEPARGKRPCIQGGHYYGHQSILAGPDRRRHPGRSTEFLAAQVGAGRLAIHYLPAAARQHHPAGPGDVSRGQDLVGAEAGA